MDDLKELFDRLREKVMSMGMEDFFPLMKKYNTDNVKELCISTGIYLGAIIFCVILIFALGWIPVLGFIIKVLTAIVILYATVGLFAGLLQYLKYN